MIVITRPYQAALRTQHILKLQGHESIVATVLDVESLPLPPLDGGRYDALLITSAHALWALSPQQLAQLEHLPLLCVGPASAEEGKNLGFKSIIQSSQPGLQYIWPALQHMPYHNILYLHGEKTAHDIHQLVIPSQHIEAVCAYRTLPVAQWSPEICQLLATQPITVITAFSAYTAQCTMRLITQHHLHEVLNAVTFWCLSQQIADVIQGCGFHNCLVEPTLQELLTAYSRRLGDSGFDNEP